MASFRRYMLTFFGNPYFLISAGVFFVYGRLLFGEMPYISDFFIYQLPEKTVIREALYSGTLPFMNPYILAGVPILNNIVPGALYPLNLLLLAGSPETGFNLFIFTHMLLAGFAMHLFLEKGVRVRRMAACLGGISYSLSGHFCSALNKGFITSAWLIPLFFLGVIMIFRYYALSENGGSRKSFLLTVFSLALLFYCGNFQEAYIAVITATVGILTMSVIFFSEQRLKKLSGLLLRYIIIIFTAVLIAAPQLLPTYLASGKSYRQNGIALHEAQHWSLPPVRIVEYFVPYIFGTRAETGFEYGEQVYSPLSGMKRDGSSPWFDSLFFGFPVMFGVIIACSAVFYSLLNRKQRNIERKTVFAACILLGAVVFYLTAAGKFRILYSLWYYILPGFKLFRHPEKFAEWINFFLISAGVYGLDRFVFSEKRENALKYLKISAVMLSVIFAFIFIFILNMRLPESAVLTVGWQLNAILLSGLLFAAVYACLSFLHGKNNIVFYSLVLADILPLILLSFLTAWTMPVEKYRDVKSWETALPDFNRSMWRIYSVPSFSFAGQNRKSASFEDTTLRTVSSLQFNAPALKHLRTPGGFDAVLEMKYYDFFNFRNNDPKKLMNILAVKYLGSGIPASHPVPKGFVRIYPEKGRGGEKCQILENPDALPRFSLYRKYIPAFQMEKTSGLFVKKTPFNTEYDTGRYFILGALPSNFSPEKIRETDSGMDFQILADNPGGIKLSVKGGPVWLVVRDWFAEGWTCRTEKGARIPIVEADGGVMAVFLPDTKATVVFRFVPPGFYPGLLMAVIGAVIILVYIRCATVRERSIS